MAERPILFSGPMIRAILAGTKTQTRRVWKEARLAPRDLAIGDRSIACPYGEAGDRLWVRETWATVKWFDDTNAASCWKNERPPALYFAADTGAYLTSEHRGRWRPSIHMPRWASRLTLEVVSVRVERVQDISEADALAEGIDWAGCNHAYGQTISAFAGLWDSINDARGYGWKVNPWVWVVEFKRVQP